MKLYRCASVKTSVRISITKRGEIGMEVTRAAIEEWAQQEAAYEPSLWRRDARRGRGAGHPCGLRLRRHTANGAEEDEGESLFELPHDVKEMHIWLHHRAH
ncbi:MAG: hypothetical protein R2881_02400 [Eubacteriales bacterium]